MQGKTSSLGTDVPTLHPAVSLPAMLGMNPEPHTYLKVSPLSFPTSFSCFLTTVLSKKELHKLTVTLEVAARNVFVLIPKVHRLNFKSTEEP